jgi:hypothetical protein
MARLPPSRHTLHRGLRIPDLRKGDDPISTSFHRDVHGRLPFPKVTDPEAPPLRPEREEPGEVQKFMTQ